MLTRDISIIVLVFPFLLFGQNQSAEIIHLENGSFEDEARASVPPKGWIDCGFPNESPVDVQPSGAWTVFHPAHQGYTYLGMVTRENHTWEAVGQTFSTPLRANQCYQFSVHLCKSDVYLSKVVPYGTKNRDDQMMLPEKNFDQPIKLQVWAGIEHCKGLQLLAESPLIDHSEWKKYEFTCHPQSSADILILMAYYADESTVCYNGNLLVDDLSDFLPIPCD